jgi:WD40 repeat protein
MNLDISPDGRLVVASGDARVVFDATNGLAKWYAPFDFPPNPDNLCFYAHTRFSPDGRFLVGKGHRSTVDVFETATFTEVAEIPTSNCAGGLAFSRDGRLVATSDPSLFGTGDWMPLSQQPPRPPGLPPEDSSSQATSKVELGPEGAGMLLTWCGPGGPCRTFWKRDGDWTPLPPALDAPAPRFSEEGHWVVGGATLLHLPTGTVRSYFSVAQVATFAPNGDIVAGDEKGNISRYCRHP